MKCKNAMSIPYYVVKKGIVPGVYRTWRDCQEQIKDYPSSFYKKFDKDRRSRLVEKCICYKNRFWFTSYSRY